MVFGIFKKNQFEKDYKKAFIQYVKSINTMYNSFKNLKEDFKKENLDDLSSKIVDIENKKFIAKEKLDECLKNVQWREEKKIKLHLQFNEIEKESLRLESVKSSIKKCYEYLEKENEYKKFNEVTKNE
jgi:hypothetical protein